MSEHRSSPISITDLVTRLMHLGADAATINEVVAYIGRERWHVIREAAITHQPQVRPTVLGFAGQLEEHCDRMHGVTIAMIGLREVLGQEASILGAHQLTLDVAQHAQGLKHSYAHILADIGFGRAS